MAFRLLACLLAGISIVALLCGTVMADPSIPLAYCGTTNTADMTACKFDRRVKTTRTLTLALQSTVYISQWAAAAITALRGLSPWPSCRKRIAGALTSSRIRRIRSPLEIARILARATPTTIVEDPARSATSN
jgi:hypothetical protein